MWHAAIRIIKNFFILFVTSVLNDLKIFCLLLKTEVASVTSTGFSSVKEVHVYFYILIFIIKL